MSHGPVLDGNGSFCEGASLADMNTQYEEEVLREPGLPEAARVAVGLVGEDGNAFSILGRVGQALREAGLPEKVDEYLTRATAGDYRHLLVVTLGYMAEPTAEDDLSEAELAQIRQAEAESQAWFCGGRGQGAGMCGVFGLVAGDLDRAQWPLAHDLLTALALAHEARGTDASGYAALTTRGQLLMEKQHGPARELLSGRGFRCLRRRRIQMVIGHTRLATTGDPQCNANNHPHVAVGPGGDQWVAVHNGWVPKHQLKAAALRLPLQTECDSELLVQALHRYGELAGPDVCLSFGGKQSVLAMHTRTRRLLAWTNGEMPLVAFRVKGWPALWWASTRDLAREALAAVGLQARFAVAEPNHVYVMEATDDGQVAVTTRRVDVRRAKA